jgi:DNA polymerase-3 subunit epsilon
MKTIIFDTEGNGYRDEKLCQLSYLVKDDSWIEAKNFFFRVDAMNEYAQKVHGFSKAALDRLSGGKMFSDSCKLIYEDFSTADILVGHNVKSDIQRMKAEFGRCGLTFIPQKRFCTMVHFNNALNLTGKRGQRKYPKLSELCRYYNIRDEQVEKMVSILFKARHTQQHDARFDAVATYLCVLQATKAGDVKGVI